MLKDFPRRVSDSVGGKCFVLRRLISADKLKAIILITHKSCFRTLLTLMKNFPRTTQTEKAKSFRQIQRNWKIFDDKLVKNQIRLGHEAADDSSRCWKLNWTPLIFASSPDTPRHMLPSHTLVYARKISSYPSPTNGLAAVHSALSLCSHNFHSPSIKTEEYFQRSEHENILRRRRKNIQIIIYLS